ncbi:hypothetical protein NMY22_g9519 [Coprinellus aureogranulatus]|nr:hypothetical protein NMY22_g9519 [Coprinellus aureogranulatus]
MRPAACPIAAQGPPEPTVAPPSTQDVPSSTPKSTAGRRSKKLNISTIKFHVLGHYPATIRSLGPSDLYSTEWGEHFHKFPKAWAKQTSRRYLRMELSRHERRRKRLRHLKQRLLSGNTTARAQELREQIRASRDSNIHHFIGMSKRTFVVLLDFARHGRFSNDIAASVNGQSFIRNMKQYLLRRFIVAAKPDFSDQLLEELIHKHDWASLVLKNDRIYTHKIMRIKYTTYDTRRDEDVIHLDTDHCNVMLLNTGYSHGSSQHPFRYCKVIGILHGDVEYIGNIRGMYHDRSSRRIEFLWVRCPALTASSIHLSSFVPAILFLVSTKKPRYTTGKGLSDLAKDKSDWNMYYINRFVDRDMLMRYEWGLAVGHTYTHRDSATVIQRLLPRSAEAERGQAAPGRDQPLTQRGGQPNNGVDGPRRMARVGAESSIHSLEGEGDANGHVIANQRVDAGVGAAIVDAGGFEGADEFLLQGYDDYEGFDSDKSSDADSNDTGRFSDSEDERDFEMHGS